MSALRESLARTLVRTACWLSPARTIVVRSGSDAAVVTHSGQIVILSEKTGAPIGEDFFKLARRLPHGVGLILHSDIGRFGILGLPDCLAGQLIKEVEKVRRLSKARDKTLARVPENQRHDGETRAQFAAGEIDRAELSRRLRGGA